MTDYHYQAAGGIGKEAVFAFAEAGAEDNICADLKGNEPPASPKKSLVDFAVQEFARIDYLVNAAGARTETSISKARLTRASHIDVEAVVPSHLTSDADLTRVFDVNARGAFLLYKAVAQH
ncbi:uncharacterized protein CC84DRAFT_1173290 [Paraphaeosphaeria sporulosa]|uniref:NAD(P)-binding protein n=1 Tax=Paraphaeosphaeria sporulosa TaxID=1460663 RepID=A0A177CTY3_9PLEO|nr:uncharacterized protein CC84DRAFT_1173290 [Paraphaeosphaeria sporulosa]OAG10984.1 hypothetical protein CC84DRAFT_1173290 [Paraphaeosphaeria sporulosa]